MPVHKVEMGIETLAKPNHNKARYMATLVTFGWARAVLEKDIRASGQEPYALNAQKHRKSNSRKSDRWSAVPLPCLSRFCFELEEK